MVIILKTDYYYYKSNMIIIGLKGGLSNQMFQYAVGRSLAGLLETELKLDKSFYDNQIHRHSKRKYELCKLNIKENFASASEIRKFKNASVLGEISAKISSWLGFQVKRSAITKEKGFEFNSEIMKLVRHSYLDGYWQSYKYFENIGGIIREEFKNRSEWNEPNREMLRLIKNSKSVAIHFRRTDYVLNRETAAFHGTCSMDYYQEAVEYIKSKVDNPKFFAFSDDIEWVKVNFRMNNLKYIDNNDSNHGELDLSLMKHCQHFVIANSSFSWWGAWLCENPDKIVIAPHNWFKDKNINTDDLIPANWIRM